MTRGGRAKGITESLPGGGRKRNVGSLTLAENRELDGERAGGRVAGVIRGRAVIYEVSKTLYTLLPANEPASPRGIQSWP